MLRVWLAGVAVVALMFAGAGSAAAALCPPGCGSDETGGTSCRICDGGGDPDPDPDPGGGGGEGHNWARPPCPASGVPEWEDHPDGWVLIECWDGAFEVRYWVERAQVDPEAIAQSLLASMNLRPIDVGMVPDAGRRGAVGLPVWMWVDSANRRTWGPYSISAGGVSMTARATRVVWRMGDGKSVSCQKGSEYRDSYKVKDSPTCGHRYSQQGRYVVTATTHWQADWTGYGQSGTIPFTLVSSRQVEIGEIQVLVTQKP